MQKRKQQQKQVVAAFGSEPDPGLGLRLVGSSERPSCLLIMGFEASKIAGITDSLASGSGSSPHKGSWSLGYMETTLAGI